MVFRAYRYGPDFEGFKAADLTSGKCTVTHVMKPEKKDKKPKELEKRLEHLGY